MPTRDAALLLLGHGSTLNADSSAPTYQHAEEVRRRGIFAEVHVAFWKEEPNFRQALQLTRQRKVYVVPNFISSGYFTEQVIPRELGLTGPVTQIGEQEIYYCAPVGLSDAMTDALLRRAHEVVAASRETFEPLSTCLFICGHGTSLNDNSTKIIHEQAEIIRQRNIYADCQPVLMEQSPFVKDWRSLTDYPNVIVVPFFISDGLHSFEDIPVLLGLTHNIREKSFTNPHRENGRRLWYATAIGTEPAIADVILAQVEQFRAAHPEAGNDDLPKSNPPYFYELMRRVPPPWTIGEVIIRLQETDTYVLTHKDDPSHPRNIFSMEDIREMLRLDPNGNFRPLRAAPNLRHGWMIRAVGWDGLREVLDYIYPAAVANFSIWKEDLLPVTSWHETAERQTGRFRVVREINDDGIRELTAQVCDPGCLKKRLWSPTAQPVKAGPQEIPLLCPEACNYLVGKAREKLKGPGDE